MYKKHSLEERLLAVQKYLEGYPPYYVGHEMGINELLYPNKWDDIEDFKQALKQYIRYYNNNRIKLKLKMSPVKYRTHFQNIVN